MNDSIEQVRKSVLDLLQLPSNRLLAAGTAGLVADTALVLAAHYDPNTFGALAGWLATIMLWFSVTAFVLSGFNFYLERHTRTLEFVPMGIECAVAVVTQRDGKVKTQVTFDLNAYNLTAESRWLAKTRIVRPWTRGRVLNDIVTVQRPREEIPPRRDADVRGMIIVEDDLYRRIAKQGITIEIADQDRNRHKVWFPHPRIDAHTVPPPSRE